MCPYQVEVKNKQFLIKYILNLLQNVPVCNGGSKQNVCEAFRVDISFIIRARTLESEVGMINDCSSKNKCKQALACVHVCSGPGMQSSGLDTGFQILMGKFKRWCSHRVALYCASAGVSCLGVERWCLSKERLCIVCRLFWAQSLFLCA